MDKPVRCSQKGYYHENQNEKRDTGILVSVTVDCVAVESVFLSIVADDIPEFPRCQTGYP